MKFKSEDVEVDFVPINFTVTVESMQELRDLVNGKVEPITRDFQYRAKAELTKRTCHLGECG